MSDRISAKESSLSTAAGLGDAAERLWHMWRQGQRPDVDAFLTGAGPLAPAQTAAVLRVDQRERWQAGERVAAEAYLQRHPAVRADPEAALDLIFNEFLLREQLGEPPDPAEYIRRFPEHADVLKSQIDLHRAMAMDSSRATRSLPPSLPPGTLDTVAADCAESPPALPEKFGRYRILRLLGQGGMGTVYLAHDTQLDRPVALKVPRFRAGDDPRMIERFYREARIAAAFMHPHLCPVYDVDRWEGVHYLTMPHLQGKSLSGLLKREGRLPEATAARLAALIARALEAAHRAGVIHRDLKPANVMLNERGEPVVMDFGLARRTASRDPRMTAAGALLGTPAYSSPEQVGGDPEAMGPAGDGYSLGVLLYEMLTGRLPFEGAVHEVMTQVLTRDPEPPSHLRPGLDPRLERICLTAMAKDPKARFASMEAFAAALENYLRAEREPPSAATVAAPAPAGKPVPRTRALSRRAL